MSMECPNCDHVTEVYESRSREKKGVKVRRRYCPNCGKRWRSEENIVSEIKPRKNKHRNEPWYMENAF